MTPRFRTDRSWRRPGDGRVVVAGSPLRLFRLTEGGAAVARTVEAGEPVTDLQARFLDRFVEAGALHPEYPTAPFTAADVTVIVPALHTVPDVVALCAGGVAGVVVVDDGSSPPLALPDGVPGNVRLVRLDANAGPGAARTAGLAEVSTPLVAFVDTDVEVPPHWLDALLPHFCDQRVALVAPRVAGCGGDTPLAQHDRRHSPLDLGDEPARVGPGTRVSYVPSAALLARTDALRAIGGFDAAMRTGEDVDLVWRLVEDGHRVRYEPSSVVHHRPRPSLASMLRQRRGYGRSAGPLAARHPGALAPVRMSAWSLAVWALVLARRPWSALAVALGTLGVFTRRVRDLPPAEAARLVLGGHVSAGRQLAEATVRVWWPVAVLLAVASRRARLPLLAAVVAPAATTAVRRRSPAPITDLPLQVLAEGAYAVGVWEGALATREPGPLLPVITKWPRRGDG